MQYTGIYIRTFLMSPPCIFLSIYSSDWYLLLVYQTHIYCVLSMLLDVPSKKMTYILLNIHIITGHHHLHSGVLPFLIGKECKGISIYILWAWHRWTAYALPDDILQWPIYSNLHHFIKSTANWSLSTVCFMWVFYI